MKRSFPQLVITGLSLLRVACCGSEIISLSCEVIDHAANIGAQHEFKTPDSTHLAPACVSKCDIFFDNDHRLERFEEISIEVSQVS